MSIAPKGMFSFEKDRISNISSDLNLNRLLKKSFFSQTRSWANKSKILSAGLPEAIFEK